MYHPFSIAGTIRSAWNVIKKNYISLIVYTMVTFLCNGAISYIGENFGSENMYTTFGIRLVIMLLEAYVTLAFYKFLLTLIDREYYEFAFTDIIPSFKMAANAVSIGIMLIFLVGTVAFLHSRIIIDTAMKQLIFIDILPKLEFIVLVYFLVRFIFCLCFIVDDDSGPIESLLQSLKITRHNFFKLLALILIIVLFVLLILLLLTAIVTPFIDEESAMTQYIDDIVKIIWFAIAFPTVQVMIITTYRKLVYSQKDVDDDVSEAL